MGRNQNNLSTYKGRDETRPRHEKGKMAGAGVCDAGAAAADIRPRSGCPHRPRGRRTQEPQGGDRPAGRVARPAGPTVPTFDAREDRDPPEGSPRPPSSTDPPPATPHPGAAPRERPPTRTPGGQAAGLQELGPFKGRSAAEETEQRRYAGLKQRPQGAGEEKPLPHDGWALRAVLRSAGPLRLSPQHRAPARLSDSARACARARARGSGVRSATAARGRSSLLKAGPPREKETGK
ncbi:proline-rich protein HaeIII subfamily 1-like [Camelus dromedarius]|uniref:proline-rich protein HaeIII subfamily 1-like n=1 Tax=Camelus dromedarius TaxID=9838 RepID=UPI003119BEF7